LDLLADKIADRVVERLDVAELRGGRLVKAAIIAKALRVSRDWVYAHAEGLGGQRLGDGPRPRWRFDLDLALERYAARPGGALDRSPE
jgi:hypothetical protein